MVFGVETTVLRMTPARKGGVAVQGGPGRSRKVRGQVAQINRRRAGNATRKRQRNPKVAGRRNGGGGGGAAVYSNHIAADKSKNKEMADRVERFQSEYEYR